MKRFVEVAEDAETYERNTAFEQWLKAKTDLVAKYKSSLWSEYVDQVKKQIMSMPMQELRKFMAELPQELKRDEEYLAKELKKELEEKKKQEMSIRVDGNVYYRTDGKHQRIVCSSGDPGFDKTGMPAYPMKLINSKLVDYYGVHVGGGWLGILKRDGYCDSGDAYLYTIHTDEMGEDGIEVYIMEDPHVSYRDSQTPDSWVIFSEHQVIPSQYIELEEVIPEAEIEEAPPSYGME